MDEAVRGISFESKTFKLFIGGSDEEFLTELDKKLDEEIAEYQADKSLEEMADVLEVLFTICEARGYSIDELMKVRDEKRENRGGFKEKIFWAGNE